VLAHECAGAGVRRRHTARPSSQSDALLVTAELDANGLAEFPLNAGQIVSNGKLLCNPSILRYMLTCGLGQLPGHSGFATGKGSVLRGAVVRMNNVVSHIPLICPLGLLLCPQ
jgi:hypothetical protein